MSLPVTVPFTFGNATTTQSLSSLDTNFTTITNSVNGLTNGASKINVASITATGTANATTYLRGDGAWATVTGGGTDATYANLTVTQNLIPPSSFLRNRIINGAMQISQRGTNFSTPANGSYTIDRWFIGWGGAAPATVAQVSNSGGYRNALQITGAASNTTMPISQRIESFNCSDLSGATVTIQANITVSVNQNVLWQLYYPTAQDNYTSTTLASSGNWSATTSATTFTATITGLPSGVTNGLQLVIAPNGGSAFTSGTITITGVQLEVGSVATPFERRQYGEELILCQRYYEKSYNNSVAVPTSVSAGTGQLFVNAIAGGATIITVNFAVSKRTSPTVVTYDNAGTSGKNTYYTTGWINGATATINTALEKGFNATLGGTGTLLYLNADWAASAEL